MPFKISENISKTLVNAYNLSSQQKAIKDNSSVIYLLRDWSLFVTCGERGVLEDLYTAPHKILWDSNHPSLLADS